jgi:hypothetical protein
MHGRVRFRSTWSVHVRNGNTRWIWRSVSRVAAALENGPKYVAPSLPVLAHHRDPREILLRVEPQADVRLVVLQLNVVARLELLDQAVLEQHRFLLGVRQEKVDVRDPQHQELHAVARVLIVDVLSGPAPAGSSPCPRKSGGPSRPA